MRVQVYKLETGGFDVLVLSSPGKGRSPVLVSDVTPENVVDKVGQAVAQVRRPKGEQIVLS